MFEALTKKDKKIKKEHALAESYNAFCYRTLGKRFEDEKKYAVLAEKLRQANMGMTPGLYKARSVITGLIAVAVALVIYPILFLVVMPSEMGELLIPVLTAVCGFAAYSLLSLTMRARISKRSAAIEKELPYTLSELAIMASTGLSPVEIFRKIAKRNEKEAISAEFKKVVYKMDIEGKDLITAISETARESPSSGFRETLWDLANMVHQGGNLDEYLRNKADTVMRLKRENQKALIDKLGTYSDLYITIVLIGVLFVSIAAFLIDAMGSSFGPFSSDMILMLMTWGMIPVSVVVFSVLISSEYSKVE